VVTEPIRKLHDLSVRNIHWQKCFLARHPRAADYDRIVFLDADIMINYHRAPCIVAATPPDRIGAVAFDRYLDDDLNAYLIGVRKGMFLTYAKRAALRKADGKPARLPDVDFSRDFSEFTEDYRDLPRINTGVLVFNPSAHGDLLEQTYHDSFREARDEQVNGSQGVNEQTFLGVKLWKAGVLHELDERFNRIASFEHAIHYPFMYMLENESLQRMCFTTLLHNCYFLHFARCMPMMKYAHIDAEEDFAILGVKNVFAGDRVRIRHRRSIG
jgi:hypothetical protein